MWLLQGTPMKVQEEALLKSEGMPGFGYFMEMGLGKTATLLADYERARERGEVDTLAVVCPNSLKSNWQGEVEAWTVRAVRTGISPSLSPDGEIFIINYEALASTVSKPYTFLFNLLNTRKVMLALDESTKIKSPQAKVTKNLLAISRLAKMTRVLSGAPLVQGIQDMWAQLKFIGGLKGMSFYQYKARYCQLGGYLGKQIVGAYSSTMQEVIDEANRIGYRARKKDWLKELPDKTYLIKDIELSPKQKAYYKQMLDDMVVFLGQNDEAVVANMVVTQLTKLQQIASGFILDETGIPVVLEENDSKTEELINILSQVDGKVIVACHFRYTIWKLSERLKKEGVSFCVIQGGLTPEEIAEAKAQFNKDGGARVMLCQQQSAKYGHTLLGGENDPCYTTVFYENSFSLDARLQMEDRNHRKGQRYPVTIIDFAAAPIDKKIIKSLQKKENLAQSIVDALKSI